MKKTAKRGLGDTLQSTLSRYTNPAVIAAILIIAFGMFSIVYGPAGITGKAIARPAGECIATGGTATGVMLLGQAGPYPVAAKMSKQNTCGQEETYPVASVKGLLLLGERCADDAGVLTLTLEGGAQKRFKSGCAAAEYADAATSNKLVKSFCYNDNKDVKLNLIGCDCDNSDCKNLKPCDTTQDCQVVNPKSECVDKMNGLGKRCYLQKGAACQFVDDCVEGLNCVNNVCAIGDAPLVAALVAQQPVAGQAAQPPPQPPPISAPPAQPGKTTLTRTFSTNNPAPNSELTVTLHFTEGVPPEASLLINEQVPRGLELLKDGKRAPANVYKQAIIEGLTGTVETKTFSYKVKIPENAQGGDYLFIGKYTLQSGQNEVMGDNKITLAGVAAPVAQRADLPDIPCKTSRDCKGQIQGMCNRKTQKCEMVPKGKACDNHEQCLTGYCKFQCRLRPVTYPCDANEQCATNQCIDGACGGKQEGEACTGFKECFSGRCAGDNQFDANGQFIGVSPDKTCKLQQLGRQCDIDEQCVLGYCNAQSAECEKRPAGMECGEPTEKQKAYVNTPLNQWLNSADTLCSTNKCKDDVCSGKDNDEPCRVNTECNSGWCNTFQGNVCSAMPFGSDLCKENRQCISGICKELGPSYHRCVSTIGGPCRAHNDCDTGICKKIQGQAEGLCEGTPSGEFGHPCGEGKARCKPGLKCNLASKACIFSEEGFAAQQENLAVDRAAQEEEQIQVVAAEEARRQAQAPQQCATTSDCQDERQGCYENFCVNFNLRSQCFDDLSRDQKFGRCADDQTCAITFADNQILGTCEGGRPSCTTHADCAENHICETRDGVKKCYGYPGIGCESNEDCGSDLSCENGWCQFKPDSWQAKCNSDRQCKLPGYACMYLSRFSEVKVCAKKAKPGFHCRRSEECASNICKTTSNVCMGVQGDACEVPDEFGDPVGECDLSATCVNKVCKGNDGSFCDLNNNHCGAGLKCILQPGTNNPTCR